MEEEQEYQGLDDLIAWQKARDLVNFVHREVAPVLPPEEKWDLTSQIRRASKSVMANIAEGHSRYYYQETIRFCYLARGSLMETYSHLVTARDLGYISDALLTEGNAIVLHARRTLNGFINYLAKSKRGGNLPGGRLREVSLDYEIAPLPDDQ